MNPMSFISLSPSPQVLIGSCHSSSVARRGEGKGGSLPAYCGIEGYLQGQHGLSVGKLVYTADRLYRESGGSRGTCGERGRQILLVLPSIFVKA